MYPFNNIRFYLVAFVIWGMIMTLFYTNTKLDLQKVNEELVKCKTDTGYIPNGDILADSLRLEIFNIKNINGKYELALEYLKESNPSAAKDFEKYLNTETE